MSLIVHGIEHPLEKSNFKLFFKNTIFVVVANYYFYIIMMVIYGFAAAQPFHYQYPILHAIESILLIFFLAVLNIGVVLGAAAKLLSINSKVLYFFPPLYCLYIKLGASPDVISRLMFTLSNVEVLANTVILFFVTYLADKLLVRIYLKLG
ncbi:hypothetical protein [Paraferrimonas haliotis]|uniref:Uncharacterized protein n=1 Tax=Paraferrimonas haliotis TaxID=2013866 RepID=A0AA37WWE6_9GAMM|nr:hypothetical protein [Paraferrimonas haliotis]GLS82324.1 hypothetical protein GCM10007894_03010 [Paraferrimonas haliotis]